MEKNITEGSTVENGKEHNQGHHIQKQLARNANIKIKSQTCSPPRERRGRHL